MAAAAILATSNKMLDTKLIALVTCEVRSECWRWCGPGDHLGWQRGRGRGRGEAQLPTVGAKVVSGWDGRHQRRRRAARRLLALDRGQVEHHPIGPGGGGQVEGGEGLCREAGVEGIVTFQLKISTKNGVKFSKF